jgi:hypothetical protein
MISKVALSCVVALGIGLLTHGVATAEQSGLTASARIVDRPALLRNDGGVRLTISAKCDPSLQAFELDVSVAQYQASGSLSELAPPAVVLCDGSRNRKSVTVYPSTGTFIAGNAAVSLFVGFYDPEADQDLAREDSATVTVAKHQ